MPVLMATWLMFVLFPAVGLPAGPTTNTARDFRTTDVPNDTNLVVEATNHLGHWIWAPNTSNKQTVHFWKAFDIPRAAKVASATLWITADNGYQLFLDGHEIGQGSDWRWVTKYDVTLLLPPGRHVLAVSAFNDALAAGLMFGLQIRLTDQRVIHLISDDSWQVVSAPAENWARQHSPPSGSSAAMVVGDMNQPPWIKWPMGVITAPKLLPLRVHFWQTGWFQLGLGTVCALAVLFSLWLINQLTAQSKAQRFLQIERSRIARDIHDDLGARLTHLVLLGEVAQSELPAEARTRTQLTEICDKARDLSHALDEVVWAVNSQRDTLRDFATYVCKYAQFFLNSTPIRCRLDVEPALPAELFALPVRRNLLLAVKEALNNAAKHSGASEVFVRIYRLNRKLSVVVEDNGRGFQPDQTDASRNGMANMTQRMNEIGGQLRLASQPGSGCRVEFIAPLDHPASRRWFGQTRHLPIGPRDAASGTATPTT